MIKHNILKGKIVTGVGDFSGWIKKLNIFYEQKTGMKLFPGTLNIKLEENFHLPYVDLRLEAEEFGGTQGIHIFPCQIFGRKAFILRTDNSENGTGRYPKTIIEIATDVKLRDKYNLYDGDTVEVIVEL
jgi:riboflavin kinase, archaea type